MNEAKMPEHSSLDDEIHCLSDLPTELLIGRWRELYGADPVTRISPDLLRRAIAQRLQEKAQGGLSKTAKRQLAKHIRELDKGSSMSLTIQPDLKRGTRLIREWRGRVHQVEVAADGFVWNGNRYRSLSQIAREITGTRWSGPRFFGLGGVSQSSPRGSKTMEQTHG